MLGAPSCTPKGCRFDPQLEHVREATDRCFSLTLMFSLSLKSIKIYPRVSIKKKKNKDTEQFHRPQSFPCSRRYVLQQPPIRWVLLSPLVWPECPRMCHNVSLSLWRLLHIAACGCNPSLCHAGRCGCTAVCPVTGRRTYRFPVLGSYE